MGKKNCISCNVIFETKRNPQQTYCAKQSCQNRRKHLWRKTKLEQDPDYSLNKQKANKRWQQLHSSYWREYRARHPTYTERNRQQQRERDRRRNKLLSRHDASHLAKCDALPEENALPTGTYKLIPLDEQFLAKSDALTVKLFLITNSYIEDVSLAKIPPYSSEPDKAVICGS